MVHVIPWAFAQPRFPPPLTVFVFPSATSTTLFWLVCSVFVQHLLLIDCLNRLVNAIGRLFIVFAFELKQALFSIAFGQLIALIG